MGRKLKKDGRCIARGSLSALLRDPQGRIFIENPTMGWNVFYVWWIPADGTAEAPLQLADNDESIEAWARDPFRNWCLEHVSGPNGKGLLAEIRHGYSQGKKLEEKYSLFNPAYFCSDPMLADPRLRSD